MKGLRFGWKAVLFATLTGSAFTQDVVPSLGQSFPFDVQPAAVRLQYAVLINDRTVLPAGTVLRSIFVDQNGGMRLGAGGGEAGGGGGRSGGRHHRHAADDDTPSAPQSSATGSGPTAGAPDAGKESKEGGASEVWTDVAPFREALDAPAQYDKTLLYANTASDGPAIRRARIELPDGMLLAEVGGHLRIVGFASDSKALQSGAKPGDEIRTLQGGRTAATLADFATAYRAVQKESATTGKPYTIEVARTGQTAPVTLRLAPVPSLNESYF